MAKSRLIIVDVSNFIFRAFFAIRPLHSPQGVPVNAVYGVFSMFQKLLSEHRPTHIFLARDSKGGSFRNELYTEYKANRSEPPEELIPQFELIEKLINVMKLPSFSLSGFEADDIIGSACTQWKQNFDEIYIASGDKDLMQFVEGNVKMLDTMKDKLYSREDVIEKMGVTPEQIVDYLSIVGDSSDNVPGMKGIGAKGAADLLKEWGTLENIISHRDQLKGKRVIEAFQNHLEDALLSKKLIEIKTDVDIGHKPDETLFQFYPNDELIQYLKDLGFKSAIQKMEEMKRQVHQTSKTDEVVDLSFQHFNQNSLQSNEIEIIELSETNWVTFQDELINSKHAGVSCHFNNEDLFQAKIDTLSCSLNGEKAYWAKTEMAEKLFHLLNQRTDFVLVSDNIKWLKLFSHIHQFEMSCKTFDIPIAHFVIDPGGNHAFGSIVTEFLNQKIDDELADASPRKAAAALNLYQVLNAKMQEKELTKIYDEIDGPMIDVLAKMEKLGITLNPYYLKDLEHELTLEIGNIERQIFEVAGDKINLNSPKQVAQLLFEKLQLPIIKKTKTGISTDAEVLEELDSLQLSPIPGLMLQHREYGKILSTYVKALPNLVNPKTKRIHTSFHLNVAQTGRLSSTNPNLQNIPVRSEMGRKVRKAFIATPGKLLLSADYSQVELRLLAHFSEDPTMLKAFRDNIDIHAQTASEVLNKPLAQISSNDRSMAKAVNFGLMYGQSSFGLASTLKISRRDAKEYIDMYFNRFSTVKLYLDKLKEFAEQHGYAETLHGRKRMLPDIYSQNRTIKAQAERMAINSPIQGTAADIIKIAMIKIDREIEKRNLKSRMLLQVHDELIFEVEEEEIEAMKALVRHEMENVVELKVPLKVEMGLGVNWYDLK